MARRATQFFLIAAAVFGIAVASVTPADAQGGGCALRNQPSNGYAYRPGK
jgi:hypothetical protein